MNNQEKILKAKKNSKTGDLHLLKDDLESVKNAPHMIIHKITFINFMFLNEQLIFLNSALTKKQLDGRTFYIYSEASTTNERKELS